MTLIAPAVPTTCRIAKDRADVAACQALRYLCFHGITGVDADEFDDQSDHVMIEQDGVLIGTLRLRVLAGGADMSRTYTGQNYVFDGIAGPSLEIGRFCAADDAWSFDVIRWAWGAVLQYVDRFEIVTLFGCTSFQGTDPDKYADAFAFLHANHISDLPVAPRAMDTRPLAPFHTGLAPVALPRGQLSDLQMSYLRLGGAVSDHLVIDHALNTMHVFMWLRVADIPAARVASLRRMAAQTTGLHIPAPRNT